MSERDGLVAAATTLVIRICSAGLTFALQVVLARLMPLSDYGGFVAIWTWMLALGSFAALGFAEASVRFVPRYHARDRDRQVQQFWRYGLRAVLAGSVLLALCGVGLALAAGPENPTGLMILLVALGLPFLAIENYLEGFARSLGWFRLTTVPVYIVRPLLIMALATGLVAIGVELTLAVVGAVLVGAMGIIALGILAIIVWRLRRDPGVVPAASAGQKALWLRAALPLLLVSGLDDLTMYADVLVLSVLLGPEEVGLYFAAARVLALANFVTYALYLVAGRQFALDLAQADRAKLQRSVAISASLTFWSTVIAVGGTLVAGPLLLSAFGAEFTAGYTIMVVLGLGMVLRAVAGQAGEVLLVAGRQRQIIAVTAISLLLSVVLSVALVPVFGVLGAALGTALAMAARSAMLIIVLRRTERLRAYAFGWPARSAIVS